MMTVPPLYPDMDAVKPLASNTNCKQAHFGVPYSGFGVQGSI
jgi:hypothetical protein